MLMATDTRPWTMEQFHRLPDDGNKYELIHGVLFVTPAPTDDHETILARLTRTLEPYVARHGLGLIYRPRAVLRLGREVEVEPDLMVREARPGIGNAWETAPRPLLVVEVLSPSTRGRDRREKRAVYRDEALIPHYWVIDGERREIHVVQPGQADEIVRDRLEWAPAGATEPLSFRLEEVLGG